MSKNTSTTFVIDCHQCKAKVAAIEKGRSQRTYFEDEIGEPFGERIVIGTCPRCQSILVGESFQIDFESYDADEDRWSDIVRVYPKPPKAFSSGHIPKVVLDSLNEADRSLQAGANIAACVMLGRALEALCRDILDPKKDSGSISQPSKTAKPGDASAVIPPKPKMLMLGPGLKKLRDTKVIDDRLYDWSQQLHAFRNLAAHPEDISISRNDAEDLQTFVYAIVEYVYDLADRYTEFKARVDARAKHKKT